MDALSVSVQPGAERIPEADRNVVHFLYCFVFPTKPKKKETEETLNTYRQNVLDRIVHAGLVVECFYSLQRDEIYAKVGATDNRLLVEADLCEHRLELEPASMRIVALSDKDAERGPIHLEAPYDKKENFDWLNPLTGTWHPLTDAEIDHHIKAQTPLSPFDHLFARYNDEWEDHHKKVNGVQIYKTYPDGSILRTATRMKLIQIALERTTKEVKGKGTSENGMTSTRGAGLNIGEMVFKKRVLAAFPLQTATATLDAKGITVDELFEKWSYPWKLPWHQPMDEIRDYFGEKIAIYFEFLAHYTKWLSFAGIVGFCVFIAQLANVSRYMPSVNFLNVTVLSADKTKSIVYTDLPVSPFYALFVSLWASFMLEFWKRKQAFFALRYGMIDFEKEETIRPEFLPSHHLPNPVTGKREPYLSQWSIYAKFSFSLSVVVTSVTVVVGAVAGIFVLKVFLALPGQSGLDEAAGGYLAILVNAVTINLLANVYSTIAAWLNDWENHRTDTAFEDALIAKTFAFSFVNSYATLFYMAFIKSNIVILGIPQYCNIPARVANASDACFGDLGASLLIIFLTQLAVGNTVEVVIPSIMGLISKASNTSIDKSKLPSDELGKIIPLRSPAEDQFYLQTYGSTVGDFLEIALQFGYTTLFVTAFPIAPFLAFVNNTFEVRVDSFKICKLCRRPEMKGAEDIGTWQYIFETMGFIAVVTNSAVICFTSSVVSDIVITQAKSLNSISGLQELRALESQQAVLVWLFVIFVFVVSSFKAFVSWLIPDIPEEVTIQVARNEYLVRKCLLRERDDEDEDADGVEVESPGSDTKLTTERRGSLPKNTFKIHDSDPEIDRIMVKIAEALLATLEDQPMFTLFSKVSEHKKEIARRDFESMIRWTPGIDEMVTSEEIRTIVTAMDNNANGFIDKEEFLHLVSRAKS